MKAASRLNSLRKKGLASMLAKSVKARILPITGMRMMAG